MSSPHADPVGGDDDATLLARARDGDLDAYARLFERHRTAAVSVAGRIAGPSQAEDITAEAFANVLDAIQRGLGPTVNFRAYLLTTIRSIWKNGIRSSQRYDLVEDYDLLPQVDQLTLVEDPDQRFDNRAVAEAFRSLPARWQAVLWFTSVEGMSHREVAVRLEIKPNAIAALSFRAREGLRHAYLAVHLHDTDDPACARWARDLPALARGGIDKRKRTGLLTHLEHCARCQAALADLREVNTRLGVLLLPIGLAAHAAGLDSMVLGAPWHVRGRGKRHLHHAVAHGKGAVVGAAAAAVLGASTTVVLPHLREQAPADLREASQVTPASQLPSARVDLDGSGSHGPRADLMPIAPAGPPTPAGPVRRSSVTPPPVVPKVVVSQQVGRRKVVLPALESPPMHPPKLDPPPVDPPPVDPPPVDPPPVDPPPVDPPPVDPPPVDPPPVDPPDGVSDDAGLGQATADHPHGHGLMRVRIPVSNLRPGAVVTVTITNIYGGPHKMAGHWTCSDPAGEHPDHQDPVASTTIDCTWDGTETASTDLVLGLFSAGTSHLTAAITQVAGVIDPDTANNTTELTLAP